MAIALRPQICDVTSPYVFVMRASSTKAWTSRHYFSLRIKRYTIKVNVKMIANIKHSLSLLINVARDYWREVLPSKMRIVYLTAKIAYALQCTVLVGHTWFVKVSSGETKLKNKIHHWRAMVASQSTCQVANTLNVALSFTFLHLLLRTLNSTLKLHIQRPIRLESYTKVSAQNNHTIHVDT